MAVTTRPILFAKTKFRYIEYYLLISRSLGQPPECYHRWLELVPAKVFVRLPTIESQRNFSNNKFRSMRSIACFEKVSSV